MLTIEESSNDIIAYGDVMPITQIWDKIIIEV